MNDDGNETLGLRPRYLIDPPLRGGTGRNGPTADELSGFTVETTESAGNTGEMFHL